MNEQASERTVRNLYDAFGRGDIPTILNMLAADVDWYDPGPAAVTHAGRYRGREDVLRFFSRIGETLAVETFQPTEFVVQGDRESGFPHGPDQWISNAATNWAAMALAFTVRNAVNGR